ncbi:hypothetical protein [Plantactinospora sp. WMMB782]|uniref:hypothetical protein n=1 Tax=Plantactinospora sp. WMMB782 TaxID=3404121 RepID=UPI003B962FE3
MTTPFIESLMGDLMGQLESAFAAMEWAEEEIEAARKRHPEADDRIWKSFLLLQPTHDLMRVEMTYRAHCRELLDRVAAGEDTRPGTAAECCIALCETSQAGPLRESAAGLYFRMWEKAGLTKLEGSSDVLVHYEALKGATIDRDEAWLRNKLRQDWRS